jgi:hypothetical protein
MEAALDEARHRDARTIVLEVQTENAPAQQVYQELGFERYHTVAELRLAALNSSALRHPAAVLHPPLAGSAALRKRRPSDWRELYDFFKAVTPAAVQAIKPVLAEHYRMNIALRLNRWLDNLLYRCQRSDWILEHGETGEISAVLQITGQYTDAAHRLQMEVHPERYGTMEDELLAAGLHRLSGFPARDVVSTVSASHPQALEAFQRAGFRTARSLDQMVFWCSRA